MKGKINNMKRPISITLDEQIVDYLQNSEGSISEQINTILLNVIDTTEPETDTEKILRKMVMEDRKHAVEMTKLYNSLYPNNPIGNKK